ncbi:MAG: hypothetical protein GY844_32565 [Bradyrhizobium sp.]|nr:hypothetical protein [Bradyrhizobium sp.]
MKWMRERDLLIAQTMAFVESVTGRRPEAEVAVRTDIPAATPARLPDVEAMLAEGISPAEGRKPAAPMPRPVTRSEYRSEILSRVEKFRANQARFEREREAYCSATMAKMQATLGNSPAPRK